MYKRLFSVIIVLLIGINIAYAQELQWMPDPELRQAVRETLDMPQNTPLIPSHLQRLGDLVVLSSDNIKPSRIRARQKPPIFTYNRQQNK